MKHVFGKSIYHRERFLIGDEVIFPPSDQLVSARIYTSNPSQTQIDAHTGHISGSEITAWSRIGDEMQIEFPALTDANPSSTNEYEIYYVVINFKYEAGGEEKFIVRPVLIWRPGSMSSSIRVRAGDVWAKEGKIKDLRGPDPEWTNGKITDAVNIVMNKLRSQGLEKKRLFDLEHLQIATCYLATALCCIDLAGEGNQFWIKKYEVYKALFDSFFTETKVGYDADGDGIQEPDEQTSGTADQWVAR